jgi:hypothetical protein
MLMLKRKVPVKVVKVELLKNVRHFSVWQLLLFAAVFAGIGGYVIYRSFAATSTVNNTSRSWPYVSPFGDRNCISYGTSNNSTSGACKSSCTGNHSGADSCGGSCVVDSSGNTASCRPRTIAICGGQPVSTLIPDPVDQGVDFTVGAPLNCGGTITYNNPSSADTQIAGTSYSSPDSIRKQVFNTPVYAMGDGKITCVAANPSDKFHEPLRLTQYCHGGNIPIGHTNTSGPPVGEGTWLVYKLKGKPSTGQPAGGLKIYVSEGCNLSRNALVNATTGQTKHRRWKAGDPVTKNSVLCEVSKGTIEMGWANEGTLLSYPNKAHIKNEIEPAAFSCFWWGSAHTTYAPTVWGHSFNEFLHKSGPDTNAFPDSGATGGPYHSCSSYPMQSKYKGSWYNANAP